LSCNLRTARAAPHRTSPPPLEVRHRHSTLDEAALPILMHEKWYTGVRRKRIQFCEWRMRKTPAEAVKYYIASDRRVHSGRSNQLGGGQLAQCLARKLFDINRNDPYPAPGTTTAPGTVSKVNASDASKNITARILPHRTRLEQHGTHARTRRISF